METYDIITNTGATTRRNTGAEDFVERVRVNHRKLASELKSHYDFIVCGSDSARSMVARWLAKTLMSRYCCLRLAGTMRWLGREVTRTIGISSPPRRGIQPGITRQC